MEKREKKENSRFEKRKWNVLIEQKRLNQFEFVEFHIERELVFICRSVLFISAYSCHRILQAERT